MTDSSTKLTVAEITAKAQTENLSNRKIKDLLYENGFRYQDHLSAIRDSLGRAKGPAGEVNPEKLRKIEEAAAHATKIAEQNEALKQAAIAAGVTVEKTSHRWYVIGLNPQEQRAIDRDRIDDRGVWRGRNGQPNGDFFLIEAGRQIVQREQREAAQEKIDAERQAEREQFADVTPDWEVWNSVKAIAANCSELADAVRYRDHGDVIAFQGAPEQLFAIAEQCGVDPESDFGNLISRVAKGSASEGQIKAAAIGLAKRAAAAAKDSAEAEEEAVEQTAAVATQRGIAHADEPVLVTRPATRRREAVRMAIRMWASKKVGKPYLAICGKGLDHEFVKGRKATGTTKIFKTEVEPGSVIHFRGATWSGEAYDADEAYALILDDGAYQIDRATAVDYDAQRRDGWLAQRRADAHEQGAARIVLFRETTAGDEEAQYMLRTPAVLIADAVGRDEDDGDESTDSPVLTCSRIEQEKAS